MKKLLVLLLIAMLCFVAGRLSAPGPAWAASVPEMYTGGIESVGSVKRISFHLRVCDWIDGQEICAWHYFGTDPEVKPPPLSQSPWPIEEHAVVQFPTDLSYLGPEADGYLYDLGRIVAGKIIGFE